MKRCEKKMKRARVLTMPTARMRVVIPPDVMAGIVARCAEEGCTLSEMLFGSNPRGARRRKPEGGHHGR